MHGLQVTKQDEGWYCEYDSKVYPSMVRRYVMLTKCTDATGELNISVFNEQVSCHSLQCPVHICTCCSQPKALKTHRLLSKPMCNPLDSRAQDHIMGSFGRGLRVVQFTVGPASCRICINVKPSIRTAVGACRQSRCWG